MILTEMIGHIAILRLFEEMRWDKAIIQHVNRLNALPFMRQQLRAYVDGTMCASHSSYVNR